MEEESTRKKIRRLVSFLQKENDTPYRKPLQGSRMGLKRLFARAGFIILIIAVVLVILEFLVPKPY